jgi:hypothetical protein
MSRFPNTACTEVARERQVPVVIHPSRDLVNEDMRT